MKKMRKMKKMKKMIMKFYKYHLSVCPNFFSVHPKFFSTRHLSNLIDDFTNSLLIFDDVDII
jgi:hypothetical protein